MIENNERKREYFVLSPHDNYFISLCYGQKYIGQTLFRDKGKSDIVVLPSLDGNSHLWLYQLLKC